MFLFGGKKTCVSSQETHKESKMSNLPPSLESVMMSGESFHMSSKLFITVSKELTLSLFKLHSDMRMSGKKAAVSSLL
jgi:hypothetical protein